MFLQDQLIERFTRYARIDTPVMPDMVGQRRPTNPAQLALSQLLVQELKNMGIATFSNDHGFVIGSLPARGKGASLTPIALMAHIDVSNAVPATNVQPQVIANYDGKPILLKNNNLVLDPAENPQLANYIGTPLITSDGTTLLGADDKAGIAIIMEAISFLIDHPELDHGAVEVVFTPDEEGGDGMSGFPLDQLKAVYAYTLDGGVIGEVEYECYNAFASTLTFNGVSYHPGDGRGRFVNAVSMAAYFMTLIPRTESPEATDGYWGCYWGDSINGTNEQTTLTVHIRDHDLATAQRRINALKAFTAATEAAFPGGKVTLNTATAYLNMRNEVEKNPEVMARITHAMAKVGVPMLVKPIRGGTDGARLTQMGRPCPNIFTGAHNLHSRSEWLAIAASEKATLVAIELIKGHYN